MQYLKVDEGLWRGSGTSRRMANSHSEDAINNVEDQTEEVFKREVQRKGSCITRPLRSLSVGPPDARKRSTASSPRRTSQPDQFSPVESNSVVMARPHVLTPRKQSVISMKESSPTKTEPGKTVSPQISPKTSQSSGIPPPFSLPKTDASKSGTPKATPRTSQSYSSPNDSPTKPVKYTSIDLENDLPEIYNTQLNPALEDPDMSEFFSRPPPCFKARSPPPIYISRRGSPSSTIQSQSRKKGKMMIPDKPTRMKIWLGLFLFVFFIFPIAILFLFRVIPAFAASFGPKA